jgi:hypothetical protein
MVPASLQVARNTVRMRCIVVPLDTERSRISPRDLLAQFHNGTDDLPVGLHVSLHHLRKQQQIKDTYTRVATKCCLGKLAANENMRGQLLVPSKFIFNCSPRVSQTTALLLTVTVISSMDANTTVSFSPSVHIIPEGIQ